MEILQVLSLGFPRSFVQDGQGDLLPACPLPSCLAGPPGSGSTAGLGMEPWPCQTVLCHVPGAAGGLSHCHRHRVVVVQPLSDTAPARGNSGTSSGCKCRSKRCSRFGFQQRIQTAIQNRNGFWLQSPSNVVSVGLPRVRRSWFDWSRAGTWGAESCETPGSPCTAAPVSLLRCPAPRGGING